MFIQGLNSSALSLDLWPGLLPTTNCHLNTSASDNLGNSWPVLYLQEREATVLEQIISYEHLMIQSGGGVEHCWALPQENAVEFIFEISVSCVGDNVGNIKDYLQNKWKLHFLRGWSLSWSSRSFRLILVERQLCSGVPLKSIDCCTGIKTPCFTQGCNIWTRKLCSYWSQNPLKLGWKIPVRSLSATINLTLPSPSLNCVPQCHRSFKYING